MTTRTAIVRNGKLELPRPLNLPDGTEVKILLPGPEETRASADDAPMPPEEIARILAVMDQVHPFDLTDEERTALDADRHARKEWEKAHFDEHAEKLRRTWE